MSINITSKGTISTNPALDVKSPAIEPITEPRSIKRDAHGRFTSADKKIISDAEGLPINPLVEAKLKEREAINKTILENDRKLRNRDALKEIAPFIWNFMEQNRIVRDERDHLEAVVYARKGEDTYYCFIRKQKSFGFHLNCGNLEYVLTEHLVEVVLNKLNDFEDVQKFTF